MNLIYIILVNYNGYRDTIECVKSIERIKHNNYKIVIVDNASTNNSVEYIKNSLKECILIESKQNLGFAGGNNIGIKYAINNGAEYVLLLNNDTLVETDFLDNMIASFENKENVGVVGCKIMYYPEKNIIWYGSGKIDWFKFIGIHLGIKKIDKGQCDIEKEIDFMTGCCMLIKRDVFEKVGLLPEEYFMYFEDVDFCIKVKDAGFKIWYNPKAVVYHKVGLSSGGEESAFAIECCTRNRLIFMYKYRFKVNKINFELSKIYFYLTRYIRYVQYIVLRKKYKADSIYNGITQALSKVKNQK